MIMTDQTIPLTGSAAALAAVGMVFRGRDPVFSAAAVAKAQQILRFATIQDERPSSYCRFVPCTTNVTITKHVRAGEGDGLH